MVSHSNGPLMPSKRKSGGWLNHSSSFAGALADSFVAAATAGRPPPLWPDTTIRPGAIALLILGPAFPTASLT